MVGGQLPGAYRAQSLNPTVSTNKPGCDSTLGEQGRVPALRTLQGAQPSAAVLLADL